MAPTQRLSPVPRFIAVRLVPALAVAVSLFFIYTGVESTRLAAESRGWPSVNGQVVGANVIEERQTSSGPRSVTYRPAIRYRYAVDGMEYEGERVSFGEYATADRGDAEAVVQRYPVGRRLPVYYRPGVPATAVLETGSGGGAWLYVALGGVFLLVGVLLAWVAPKLIAPA
jgi:hypothetical protein